MLIRVNGNPYSVEGELNVQQLAEELALNTSRMAVERNREIVPRSRYGEVMLSEGDVIEFVQFIGGG